MARAMAQKERERKQAVGHYHPPAASDGAKPDLKVRPLQNIASTNSEWCVAYKGAVGGGRILRNSRVNRKQAVGHHHPLAASDGAKPDLKVRLRVELLKGALCAYIIKTTKLLVETRVNPRQWGTTIRRPRRTAPSQTRRCVDAAPSTPVCVCYLPVTRSASLFQVQGLGLMG